MRRSAEDQSPLAAPEDMESPRTPKRRSRLSLIITLVLVSALAGTGIWWFSSALPAQQAAVAEAQATELARVEEAEKKKKKAESDALWAIRAKEQADKKAADLAAFHAANAEVRKQLEAEGWTWYNRDLYYRLPDKATYTCERTDCVLVEVTATLESCPMGIRVEVTTNSGDVAVSKTNASSTAMIKGERRPVMLEVPVDLGQTLLLTDIKCMSRWS